MSNVSTLYINNEPQPQFVTSHNCYAALPEDDPLKSPLLVKQLISDTEHRETDSYRTRANYSGHLDHPPRAPLPPSITLLNLPIHPAESLTESKTRTADAVALSPRHNENISRTIGRMLEKRQRNWTSNDNVNPSAMLPNGREFNVTSIDDNVEPIQKFTSNTLDRSCRVTGELLKKKIGYEYRRHVCTLPTIAKSHRSQLLRHFYHPKSRNRIPDEELPDPDQVKNTREIFERVLETSSAENLPSLTNNVETCTRPTPESRQPRRTRLRKNSSANACQPCKWSNAENLTSGVGSDTEKFDTQPRDSAKGGNNETVAFANEETLASVREGKVIAEDVLRGIRAYGICITYFGGKIVSSAEGYSCSPTTMTVINEIKQSPPPTKWYQANRKFRLFNDRQPAMFRVLKNIGPPCEGRDDNKRVLNTPYDDCNNNEVNRETNTMSEYDVAGEGKLATKVENSSMDSEEDEKVATKFNSSAQQKWSCAYISVESKPRSDVEFEKFQIIDDKTTN